ncbi:MAG: ADP-ribose pyrophosphatase YjhB (NUDIX family) [Bacteroidia bacterium]|jgi:ADP-ribose pyrophosphatase YjhB (NUDIX family)
MSDWTPRATVACVVARQDQYLMVEEREKSSGKMVFNQPAGHLEPDETLAEGVLREVAEETGWTVELNGVLGIALYRPPQSDFTYYRTTFVGTAVQRPEDAIIDPDIHAVHWLSYEEILTMSDKMRSPLVLDSIERHRRGLCFPLDLISVT